MKGFNKKINLIKGVKIFAVLSVFIIPLFLPLVSDAQVLRAPYVTENGTVVEVNSDEVQDLDAIYVEADRIQNDPSSASGIVKCDNPPNCGYQDLINTINNGIQWVVMISAVVAGMMFAYAGFLYITANGDTGQIKKAHGVFINVAIGFVIILSAWLIIKLLIDNIGVKDSRITDVLTQ